MHIPDEQLDLFAQRLSLRYAAKRAPRLRLGVTLSPKGGLPMQVSARRNHQ